MAADKDEEKGFVVKDRRFSASKEAEEKPPRQEEPPAGEENGKAETSPPEESPVEEGPVLELTFMNYLQSLAFSSLIHLGEIPDPTSSQNVKSLPMAKQTIDLLGLLREKTKGNLTVEEEKAFEYILYDLRVRYVKASQ
jgi:hypothetical protein